MAIFSNQATLTIGNTSVESNIAYGEILDVLTVSKTALEDAYTPGDTITYVVALRNTGNTALTALTVSDDLGGSAWNGSTLYPLAYIDGSAMLYIDGVLQPAPAVTAGPPLSFTGITVPAGGDAIIIYQARVTSFADPMSQGTVTNTVTVTGNGLSTPVTDSETVGVNSAPALSITKTISPAQVTDNDRVTYAFLISNTGNTAVVATDDAIITDTFDPILTDLTVIFNGTVWTEGTEYTYDAATGEFATLPGSVTVPAADYVQNPVTGEYTVTPGTSSLTVTATI